MFAENIDQVFACKYCNYETADIDILDEHIVKHDEALVEDCYNCDCDADGTNRILCTHTSNIRHKLELDEYSKSMIMLVCPYCEFITNSKIEINRHFQEHVGPPGVITYSCAECSYTTCRKNDMNKHLFIHVNNQNTNNEMPSYECEVCSYTTIKKWCLTKHMFVHKIAKETDLFSCEKCKYVTKRRSDMVKHKLKVHILK